RLRELLQTPGIAQRVRTEAEAMVRRMTLASHDISDGDDAMRRRLVLCEAVDFASSNLDKTLRQIAATPPRDPSGRDAPERRRQIAHGTAPSTVKAILRLLYPELADKLPADLLMDAVDHWRRGRGHW